MILYLALVVLLAPGTPPPKKDQVSLDAVGDVMLGRWIGRHLERDGVKRPFWAVHAEFHTADVVIGNLECALTTRPFARAQRFHLRAEPGVAPGLKWAGFTFLSLENNHAGDCGPKGVSDSISTLRRVGIYPLAPGPVFRTVRGIRLGVVAIADLPGYETPGWQSAVAAAVSGSDVAVVMIHWGIELSQTPSPRQRTIAQQLAAMGVRLILGAHPHVLQPIERVGSAVVAYSLGNFVFDARPGKERESEIARFTFTRAGVTRWRTLPIHLVHGYPEPTLTIGKPKKP